MATLFAIGSFWFWALVTITFILVTIYVNRDEENDGKVTTTIFILSLGAFFFFGNRDLFFSLVDFIKNSPLTFISYIAGYLALGSVWSFVKWYYYLIDTKKKYLEEKKIYKEKKLSIPKAKNHKGDIIMWMSYWIPSLFWTLVNNWVRKVWTTIFANLEGVYNKLSKHVFKDLDLQTEEETEEE